MLISNGSVHNKDVKIVCEVENLKSLSTSLSSSNLETSYYLETLDDKHKNVIIKTLISLCCLLWGMGIIEP